MPISLTKNIRLSKIDGHTHIHIHNYTHIYIHTHIYHIYIYTHVEPNHSLDIDSPDLHPPEDSIFRSVQNLKNLSLQLSYTVLSIGGLSIGGLSAARAGKTRVVPCPTIRPGVTSMVTPIPTGEQTSMTIQALDLLCSPMDAEIYDI